MKPLVLAKIVMQVGEYFRVAYEYAGTNRSITSYDGGKFAQVLNYHSLYFTGVAYFITA